jgi:2-polyprenyl-3-methyl-5-hydroxy-6-metoxy-1,4-benzoquinol methylase
LQAKLVVLYVVQAFGRLGCPLASLQADEPLPPIRHQPQHQKVVKQFHRILIDAGVIRQNGTTTKYERTSLAVPTGSIPELHNEIMERFPQHRSEHKLLHSTGTLLAECLDGQEIPTGIIFGTASARETLSDVYANAPMFKAGTIMLAKYLTGVFEVVDPSTEINVLELGAGTGGTTSLLLEELAAAGRKFTYTFTDLSPSLVAAAKKKFRQYDFMRYKTMNIETEPTSEHLNKYHIVISTNCIHATSNLVTSTTNINKMLSPDGILCLVELTRNLFWFDLVFGLLEGWWLFNDGREHVLADPSRWQQCLKKAGYNWVAWSQGESDESNVCRLITASKQTADAGFRAKASLMDSFPYKEVDGLVLQADVHYPPQKVDDKQARPVG